MGNYFKIGKEINGRFGTYAITENKDKAYEFAKEKSLKVKKCTYLEYLATSIHLPPENIL